MVANVCMFIVDEIGEHAEIMESSNLVVNTGLLWTAYSAFQGRGIADPVAVPLVPYAVIGTDPTPPTPGDSALITPATNPIKAMSGLGTFDVNLPRITFVTNEWTGAELGLDHIREVGMYMGAGVPG